MERNIQPLIDKSVNVTYCYGCIYNEGGYCNADMIEIVDGDCNTFERIDEDFLKVCGGEE